MTLRSLLIQGAEEGRKIPQAEVVAPEPLKASTPATVQVDRPSRLRALRSRVIRRARSHSEHLSRVSRLVKQRTVRANKRRR